MYCEHFSLSAPPFNQTPDLRFFQNCTGAGQLFNTIIRDINSDISLIQIVADPGMGKTLLCRKLLRALHCHSTRYAPVFMVHTGLRRKQLLHHILETLNPAATIPARSSAIHERIRQELKFRAGETVRIIIVLDEAQTLSASSARSLLTLLPGDQDTCSLQLLAFGHEPFPEAEVGTLADLPARCSRLEKLQPQQIEDYIHGRLERAGWQGKAVLLPDALARVVSGSRGVPRLINILMHKSMLLAYLAGSCTVLSEHVEQAIESTPVLHRAR